MIPEGLPDARRPLRAAIFRHILGGSTDRRTTQPPRSPYSLHIENQKVNS